jgi:uncharacterized protein (DUF3820 family)
MPQRWDAFKMPFGKYHGKTLKEIKEIDLNYFTWCAENLNDEKIKNKFIEGLNA